MEKKILSGILDIDYHILSYLNLTDIISVCQIRKYAFQSISVFLQYVEPKQFYNFLQNRKLKTKIYYNLL